jgi:hypothetical protein
LKSKNLPAILGEPRHKITPKSAQNIIFSL